jgi:hypothetical protein
MQLRQNKILAKASLFLNIDLHLGIENIKDLLK